MLLGESRAPVLEVPTGQSPKGLLAPGGEWPGALTRTLNGITDAQAGVGSSPRGVPRFSAR